MTICKNRIKPLLLRDVKTEALLVFIRTTLEDYFKQIENSSYYFELGSKEDNQFVFNELKKLLEKLQSELSAVLQEKEALEKLSQVLPRDKMFVVELPKKDTNEMLMNGLEDDFIDRYFRRY